MADEMKTLGQVLGTSSKGLFDDDMPELRTVGAFRDVLIENHHMRVTATAELGCDTGRRRYRVVCRSCRVVVHPATTGPHAQMDTHVRWFEEDGKPTPFPGTAIGVVE